MTQRNERVIELVWTALFLATISIIFFLFYNILVLVCMANRAGWCKRTTGRIRGFQLTDFSRRQCFGSWLYIAPSPWMNRCGVWMLGVVWKSLLSTRCWPPLRTERKKNNIQPNGGQKCASKMWREVGLGWAGVDLWMVFETSSVDGMTVLVTRFECMCYGLIVTSWWCIFYPFVVRRRRWSRLFEAMPQMHVVLLAGVLLTCLLMGLNALN